MKKIFLLCGIILCTACTTESESNYIQNVKSLVGHTPEELILQWGKPTQVISNQGKQYYVYMFDRKISLPNTVADGGIDEENAVYPLQKPQFYQADLFCQTTFVIQNEEIVDWSFEGNDCVAR